MMENRNTALFKRAEQLKRWVESETNKQSALAKKATRIKFSHDIVFLAACIAGDKEEVLRLVQAGADVNTSNIDGLTALHQACIDNRLDMVEHLIDLGADVNCCDNEGWTPLHATSSCGFNSIARFLLESGADVAAVNCEGDLPGDIAENEQMADMIQQVVQETGIDIEAARSAEERNLLSDAKVWAETTYAPTPDPKSGGTPLHVAASKGYMEVLRILLEECGADPDCVDFEGWTPLHAAVLWGQQEAAALLISHGASVHKKNRAGQTCHDLVDPSMAHWLKSMESKKRTRQRADLPPEKRSNNAANMVNSSESTSTKPRGDEQTKDMQVWRRSTSLRARVTNDQNIESESSESNTIAAADTSVLRRTASFENDRAGEASEQREQRERDAANAPSGTPPAPSSPVAASPSTPVAASPSSPVAASPSPTAPLRRSFVPPTRDEESETQRKAHAKRVRETRRSTQGVTLDEIKSAEQLARKKPTLSTSETFELVDANRAAASSPSSSESLRLAALLDASSTSSDTSVTVTLRPPAHAPAPPPSPPHSNNIDREEEQDRRSGSVGTGGSVQSALNVIQRRRRPKRRSTGVGNIDYDAIEVEGERGSAGEDVEGDARQSGTERTSEARENSNSAAEAGGAGEEVRETDYRALWKASQMEVARLREMLSTNERELREAHATIGTLSHINQNSLTELEKREKRAMERKLSEMEEELKQLQKLKAENERLRAENRALTRVVSKLTNSAASK